MADAGGVPPEVARGWIGAAIGAIGTGLGWLFRSRAAAKRRRDERLDAWHHELEEREKRLAAGQSQYVQQLERRLADVEAKERAREAKDEARDEQLRALRISFELVSSALRKIDAGNPALSLAEQLLRAAFPVTTETPEPMQADLRRLGAAEI
ncbi:hypothetical protein [Rhizorhabdus histidinilytica]|uniref:hypothetical protein n=1 Tax=Rhizorhabdus histidinilytica TaxID=439228 RepID=UPI00168108F5|nr:hypothetical protein [Rhizorhabdus histidinilytica]